MPDIVNFILFVGGLFYFFKMFWFCSGGQLNQLELVSSIYIYFDGTGV
jgi:hypothetical protein